MNTDNQPLVSILSSSFNHEKYVKFFIESVLAQTNPNWELIIVDDCSTDNNISEIKKFTDSRIKLFQQKFNMGINCASMRAFKESKGKYIIQCASDDMLMPAFVQTVINFMNLHPEIDVFYPRLQCIDSENNLIPGKEIFSYSGTKYEILNRLFYKENCLTSPGLVMRRSAFAAIQPLDIAISQHQDYKIHIQLLLNSNCFVSQEKLVLYRLPSAVSGISYSTPISQRRCDLEENMVMDSFLKINSFETLLKIFGNDIEQFGADMRKYFPRILPFVLGKLAMKSDNEFKKMWGYYQIVRFINTPDNYDLLHKLYGFCYRDFLNLANDFKINSFVLKYRKYKRLFNWMLALLLVLLTSGLVFFCQG